MDIAAHLEKLRRFEIVRARMDPLEEFEMWYWMTLSGGTTIINAALHAAGLTDADQHFATQIPDVYVVPVGDQYIQRIAVRKDLIHVGLPPLEADLPREIAAAFAAMEMIERYRDPCVRGDHEITSELVNECELAYGNIVSNCRHFISGTER